MGKASKHWITCHLTFFLKVNSEHLDQSFREVIEVETTAISTPLDKVPL